MPSADFIDLGISPHFHERRSEMAHCELFRFIDTRNPFFLSTRVLLSVVSGDGDYHPIIFCFFFRKVNGIFPFVSPHLLSLQSFPFSFFLCGESPWGLHAAVTRLFSETPFFCFFFLSSSRLRQKIASYRLLYGFFRRHFRSTPPPLLPPPQTSPLIKDSEIRFSFPLCRRKAPLNQVAPSWSGPPL